LTIAPNFGVGYVFAERIADPPEDFVKTFTPDAGAMDKQDPQTRSPPSDLPLLATNHSAPGVSRPVAVSACRPPQQESEQIVGLGQVDRVQLDVPAPALREHVRCVRCPW
jgi:hypothetical protein